MNKTSPSLPVKGTGKRRRIIEYRQIATAQERRMAADPNIKKYVRPGRNSSNLPDGWLEDRRVPRTRDWKRKTKRRHQWEKR